MHRHVSRVVTLGLALLLASSAFGSWMFVPLEKRIMGADVVVLGKIAKEVRGFSRGRFYLTLGVIEIEEVLKGDAKLKTVKVAWPAADPKKPAAPRIRMSTDIEYRVGQEGVWILRHDAANKCYWANYPTDYQRDAGEKALKKIRATVAKQSKLSRLRGNAVAIKKKSPYAGTLDVAGKDSKPTRYYIASNALSIQHFRMYRGARLVLLIGAVKDVDGKKIVTASLMEPLPVPAKKR
jgi:hypothetical protein